MTSTGQPPAVRGAERATVLEKREMRVVLLHNPTAGSARGDDEIAHLLREAGHRLVAIADGEDDLASMLRERVDVVAVAGGDGTVAKAARVVWGSPTPLAILPSGTANNLARSLGLASDVRATIAAWMDAAPRALDGAIARWESGDERRLVEAIGVGLFPRVMQEAERMEAASPPPDAEAALRRDRALLVRHVTYGPAEPVDVTVDGADRSGRYLLVEVMVSPLLGPNLRLAPGGAEGDGLLDVVLVADDGRAALVSHLEAPPGTSSTAAWPPTPLRARSVELRVDGPCHLDGKLVTPPGAGGPDGGQALGGRVVVTVEPGAFRVLAPPRRG